MGKNWQGTDVRQLPQGSGYLYLRSAFFDVINKFKKHTENLILIGHVKDITVEKDGEEVSAYEVDLTGKIKTILSSRVDALGYIYRKNNENIISFKPSQEVICGNRSKHLADRDIVISKKEGDAITTFWKEIYK